MLTPFFWPIQNGMEMVFHNLAGNFIKKGHNVFLFAPEYHERYEEIRSSYHLIRYGNDYVFLNRFKEIHKKNIIDVLLVQSAYEAATLALDVRSLYNIPLVLRPHGSDVTIDYEIGYGWRIDKQKNEVITNNFLEVDRCIAISNVVKKQIHKIGAHIAVDVINNGVDLDKFYPDKCEFVSERYGLNKKTFKILMMGRNVKKKSFHLGIDAFSLACKRNPDLTLIHAGPEGNGKDLEKYAESKGVSSNFFRIGPVNYHEIQKVYNSCDLLLFPSKSETFGNVTIEAMACGLPCIEFDYGANWDKIENGVSGYIVPYGNIHMMSLHILEISKNFQIYHNLSNNARQQVVDKFSWDHVANKYIECFESTISNFKSHRSNHCHEGVAANISLDSLNNKENESELIFSVENCCKLNRIDHVLAKAISYQRMGKFNQALRLFSEILEKKPEDLLCLYFFACLMYQMGMKKQSVSMLTSLANNKNLAPAHNKLGIILRHKRNHNSALDSFQKAWDIDPNKHYKYNLVEAERSNYKKITQSSSSKQPDILVCLLNYKRPENLRLILESLKNQSIKPRIALWDNSGLLGDIDNIDNLIRSSDNLFCLPRWNVASLLGEEYVCIIDDDLYPNDKELLAKCVNACQQNFDQKILGYHGRLLPTLPPFYPETGNDVFPDKNHNRYADIIKGRFMFLHINLLNLIPLRSPVYLNRGDDIWISLMSSFHNKYHIIPSFMTNSLLEMKTGDESMWKNDNHFEKRNYMVTAILKYYSKNKWFDSYIEKSESVN